MDTQIHIHIHGYTDTQIHPCSYTLRHTNTYRDTNNIFMDVVTLIHKHTLPVSHT